MADDQELAKLLFLRLDPILRLLLATIERYKQLEEENDGTDSRSRKEETKIGFLKSQVQLLDVLKNELVAILSDDASCCALVHIADYLLLPLQAILQLAPVTSNSTTTSSVLDGARQSHTWQCQERAAKILTLIVQKCSIDSAITLEMLILCTMSLDPDRPSCGLMDRREALSKAVLQCINVLSASLQNMSSVMDGTLLARVVLICITIIEQDKSWSSDLDLVLQALETIWTLLEDGDRDAWRRMFPGISVALLRLILRRGKAVLTARSIDCLGKLFSVTMREATNESKPLDVAEQLRALGIRGNHERTEDHDYVKEIKEDVFVRECRERLPGPLTVLLGMLPSFPSTDVRISAAKFCEILVMDTWNIWTNIHHSALQCCIVLSNDLDDDVQHAARHAITSFKDTPQWKNLDRTSTVLAVIYDLPTYTKSLRVLELQSKLRLAIGYLEHLGDSSIGNAMAGPLSDARLSLASLFDIDFESLQPSIALTTQPARYRFIRDETVPLAYDLVKVLARTIGAKQACLLIDACFADLHESYIGRPEGLSNVSWIHEWVGVTIVADQVLLGMAEQTLSDKEHRKTQKRIKALASALLPLITTSPLWKLPTVQESAKSQRAFHKVSAESLRANTVLVRSTLQFLGTLVGTLRSDTTSIIPVLIYPLFEKASEHNHGQVQSTALSVLKKVSEAVGTTSVERLISVNFDYLFGAIQAKIRLFASLGSDDDQPLGNIPSIARTVLKVGLQSSSKKSEVPMQRTITSRNNVTTTVKTAHQLILLSDRRANLIGRAQDVSPLLDLIEFYEGSILHLVDSFWMTRADLEKHDNIGKTTSEPWLELLQSFQVSRVHEEHDAVQTDVKESIDISQDELHYLSTVLARCGYLISHPSLTVRIASCRVQTLAFLFLSFVTSHYVKPENDETTENPGNSIYRQVSDSWPAISSRIEALSREVSTDQKTKGTSVQVSNNALPAADNSSHVIFLSTLLTLVASMSTASGSFIWRRLEETVLPACVRIIAARLNEGLRRATNNTLKACPGPTSLSEHDKLLLSVFQLYRTIFKNEELGNSAARTVSSIGSMMIPFLDDGGAIGDAAVETLKTMLSVDNDALWRPLLSASGEEFPPNPLLLFSTGEESTNTTQVHLHDLRPHNVHDGDDDDNTPTLLRIRAKELLDFANICPEQSLNIY